MASYRSIRIASLLLATLFLPCLTTNVSGRCPQRCVYPPLIRITPCKTVHFATTTKMNYYDASNYCRRHCMHLVSIESQAEQTAIENHIRSGPYRKENFWTSGNDLWKRGSFVWASTGNQMIYTNWYKGEPYSGVWPNCVHLWNPRNLQWNDSSCNYKMYFICELRP